MGGWRAEGRVAGTLAVGGGAQGGPRSAGAGDSHLTCQAAQHPVPGMASLAFCRLVIAPRNFWPTAEPWVDISPPHQPLSPPAVGGHGGGRRSRVMLHAWVSSSGREEDW